MIEGLFSGYIQAQGTDFRLIFTSTKEKKNVTAQNHQFDIFSQFIEMDYLIVINEKT